MENMTKEKREEIIEKAKDKLKAEEKSGKYGVKENAMKGEVLKALAAFAEQDVEFAEAIICGLHGVGGKRCRQLHK